MQIEDGKLVEEKPEVKTKTERKASLQVLQEMISPEKPFKFENPENPDDIVVFLARKLSPGHLLNTHNTAFIKAYQKKQEEDAAEEAGNSNGDAVTAQEAVTKEAFDNIMSEVEYSTEIASISIIDAETKQNYLTPQDVMEYMMPEWHSEISTWALGGATPQDKENPDEVDTFPPKSD